MPKSSSQMISQPMGITLKMQPAGIRCFLPLLGEGFIAHGKAGLSVKDFLCHEVGVPADYLRDRVQTVFLDGKAIDDLDSTAVADNSIMALSAAMPGLAGAVLRRGGFYAAMRRQISHQAGIEIRGGETAAVTLKLFNLVARELGPEFLDRGILIPCRRLKDFIERQGRWIWARCDAAEVDGTAVDTRDLPEMLPPTGQTMLTIQTIALP